MKFKNQTIYLGFAPWITGYMFALAAVSSSAGVANPLVAPQRNAKVEKESAGQAANNQNQSPPQSAIPGVNQSYRLGGQTVVEQTELPAERWLALATVTSVVGDRATLLVPSSLTDYPAQNGQQFGGSLPASSRSTAGNGVFAGPQAGQVTQQNNMATNQPQTAVQQARQEILYVRSESPLFFKGEKYAVIVSGREVMIWSPSKTKVVQATNPGDANNSRYVVFFGTVSSTELGKRALVGSYAPSDPAVLKRITPTYSSNSATSLTGNSVQSSPTTGVTP